jgi:hypothetical protein
MTGDALHSLAEEMSTAFMGEILTMTKSERIIELAGAQWVGVDRNLKPLVIFRDPITRTTCALPEAGLTVARVQAKLAAKRAEFGGVPS